MARTQSVAVDIVEPELGLLRETPVHGFEIELERPAVAHVAEAGERRVGIHEAAEPVVAAVRGGTQAEHAVLADEGPLVVLQRAEPALVVAARAGLELGREGPVERALHVETRAAA